MLANYDTFHDLLKEMNSPKAGRSRNLLTERSVNIYSDMGDYVHEGDIITLTGELVGFDSIEVTLQWQFDNGTSWVDVPGANKPTHSFVATPETVDYSWRLSVVIDE